LNYTVGDLLKEQGAALKLDLVAGGAALGRRILGADLNRPGLALSGFLEKFPSGAHSDHRRRRAGLLPESAGQAPGRGALGDAGFPGASLPDRFPVPQGARRLGHGLPQARRAPFALGPRYGDLGRRAERGPRGPAFPAATLHGVLVNVYGLGVLIQGEAGIGKSECALGAFEAGTHPRGG